MLKHVEHMISTKLLKIVLFLRLSYSVAPCPRYTCEVYRHIRFLYQPAWLLVIVGCQSEIIIIHEQGIPSSQPVRWNNVASCEHWHMSQYYE